MNLTQKSDKTLSIQSLLNKGVSRIAPLWSLDSFVAVNPYLGLADMKFQDAMLFLHKSSKVEATLPLSFYLNALHEDIISKQDLKEALSKDGSGTVKEVEEFLYHLQEIDEQESEFKLLTLAEVASSIYSKEWSRFMVDRISFWASAYFDKDQALWDTAPRSTSLFKAWKKEAEIDFSMEAMGLKGFRKFLRSLPDNHLEAAEVALQKLEVPEGLVEAYLTGLLMTLNGWAGFAARIDWDAKLQNKDSRALEEFLSILLVWELCLKELLESDELANAWNAQKVKADIQLKKHNVNTAFNTQLIMQEAFDLANQRKLITKINTEKVSQSRENKPKVQAIFCIDVRSELYRRNLEAANPEIETMGFAGFFAFPIKYVPLAYHEGSSQCPVLLTPSHTVKEGLGNSEEEKAAVAGRTLRAHLLKAWKSFKLGAITCFSFVGPVGLAYLPKLFSDSFGFTRPITHPDVSGLNKKQLQHKQVNISEGKGDASGIPAQDRIQMAAGALKAMSLTENFAEAVLIVGHGSSTVNNPHATGLDCGACGGNTGEANAKVAATILNDPEVRIGLQTMGISIPNTTVFVAALHDTTRDEVKLFHTENEAFTMKEESLKQIQFSLKLAGETSRRERAVRMKLTKGNIDRKVLRRSTDWSQVRPEWGLAGCSSFIVAPRKRTEGLDFKGKAFMHSYNWQKDENFAVLELIMTAPMVVTSWINLQYYASTVDNKKFGSGNKTLHNVVGGLGVLEGFGGDLRVGLPYQSVHDGEQFQHEPQRLNVFIEAPIDEMSKILAKNDTIKQLCDNEWIYLFGMNDEGKVAFQYCGDLQWEMI